MAMAVFFVGGEKENGSEKKKFNTAVCANSIRDLLLYAYWYD